MSRMICRGKVILHITYETPFDGTLCGVLIEPSASMIGGGGSTFDCYSAQEGDFLVLDQAGNGVGIWGVSTGSFGWPRGDTFDSYFAENPLTQSLSNGVNVGIMKVANSNIKTVWGEIFDYYAAENPLTTTITGSIIGRTGNWYYGNGP